MNYIIIIVFIMCFLSKAGQKKSVLGFDDIPLEITEHIICYAVPTTISLSCLAYVTKLSFVNTNFFSLMNNPQSHIQKKLQSIFKSMWDNDYYGALVDILRRVPPHHMLYKTLCRSLEAQYINKEFIQGIMTLFENRATLNIHDAIAEKFNTNTLHQTIIITAVHKCHIFENNICNNELNDASIEYFIKQLTTLYPHYMNPLFNKTLLFLIGYIAERQYRLNKVENLQKSIEVRRWFARFQQVLVY